MLVPFLKFLNAFIIEKKDKLNYFVTPLFNLGLQLVNITVQIYLNAGALYFFMTEFDDFDQSFC